MLYMYGPHANASTFANTTSITIRDTNTAVPYPSTITVSGLTGTISTITVELNGFSHGSPSDIEMLLVSPAGKKFVFFSDAGGMHQVSGMNIAFADSAASLVPSFSLTAGAFKPTDYGGLNLFASPAPVVAIYGDLAPTYGTDTFFSQFYGADPNGIWNLYIVDDVSGASGTLTGGWALTITTVPPVATMTILQSSPNPSLDSAPLNTVMFNAMVTSSGRPVTQGTVTFTEGPNILKANMALSASGQAMYTNNSLVEGSHVITASYSGSAGFAASSSSVTQIVNTRTLMLTNVTINPSKQFQFRFAGITMVTYTVLASTNLKNWSVLGPANENPPGQYFYIDPNVSNFTRRYYRVQQP